MNIKNCKICGSIFNYLSGPCTCPKCREEQEKKFQEVKEYIRDHKGVTIPEVAKACDVEAQIIKDWLRDDRLEVTEDSSIFLTCESCGAEIRSGKYCEKCKAKMANGLNNFIQANKPKPQEPIKKEKENPKMRFL